jgi:hypothetical protein
MEALKPGQVRTFRNNAVVLAIGLWAKREGKYLRIDITGTGKHTTVSDNPNSARYHRTLFRDLRRVLVRNQRWPFGSEGSEVEESS